MAKTNKTLVIVESPNKVKKISAYLGPDYVVRACFGHIADLSTEDPRFNLGIDMNNGYKPRYQILQNKKDKLAAIIDASTYVDKILLASDPDREGEAIAWHLQESLDSTGKEIKRITFNEITKAAVLKAVANPRDIDMNLFRAQEARRVVDRLVGFLASDYLRSAFKENLSAGRVQSVAAKLIIDRDKEIASFKKEEYWNIYTNLEAGTDKVKCKLQSKIINKTGADAAVTKLKASTFTVSNVDAKEKKRKPLPPLTTSTMQQYASQRLGFPVAKTMRAAQLLYESGFITYLRTDSTRLSPESVKMARDYLTANTMGMPKKPNTYEAKDAAQDAHEAIRPSDVNKLPNNIFMDDDSQKLYRIIWERFVACQMEDAIYDTVALTIDASGGYVLKASGRSLKSDGWLSILPNHKADESDDDEGLLPVLTKGDKLKLDPNIVTDQKFTPPPPKFTEATLVRELERRGIGRPSTYAEIIEKIKGRNYVEMKGKAYIATDIGTKVIDKLSEFYSFMDYSYTAEMEVKLDKVAEGKLDYFKMIDDFFKPFQQECRVAEEECLPDFGFTCEKCGSKMKLRHGTYGYYMACVYRPQCKGTVSVELIDGKPVAKEFKQAVSGHKCPKCNSDMFCRDGKFGPFLQCVDVKCNGKARMPANKTCTACGNKMHKTLINGVMKYSCITYPSCQHTEELPKEDAGTWIDPEKLQDTKSKTAKKLLGLA